MAEGNALYAETAKEMYRLRAENGRLRDALVEAIPFIGYQAHVPDIVARCRALVEEAPDA